MADEPLPEPHGEPVDLRILRSTTTGYTRLQWRLCTADGVSDWRDVPVVLTNERLHPLRD
jgi:hypothetical protein